MGRLDSTERAYNNQRRGRLVDIQEYTISPTELLVRIGSASSKDIDLKKAESYEEW